MNRLSAYLRLRRLAVTLLMMVMLVPCSWQALAADCPAITNYYPGKSDDNPQELKPQSKAWLYFATGTKAVSAKAHVVQNDKTLGTVVYTGPEAGAANLSMDPQDASNNAVLELIEPGLYTFDFYELTYYADGELTTYSGESIGTVTYKRQMPNGKVVNKQEFADQTMLSYYPEDGVDGVLSFTFDKPIDPSHVNAYLSYGQGLQYFEIPLQPKVSADGLTLTIDFRGKCYNVDALAPGVTFVDEMGNPTPPPTSIAVAIENLKCTDGSQIGYTYTSLDGDFSQELAGRIHLNYHYKDLTIATPVIEGVAFYASSKPAERFPDMTKDTDMMAVILSDTEVLKSADVKIEVGNTAAVVPFADIKINGQELCLTIPSSIRSAGTAGMVVRIVNEVYTEADGAQHVIKPYYLDSKTPEVATVAELKQLAPETAVVLNLADGLLVTLANEQGYTFAEDATGGVQIVSDKEGKLYNQGDVLKGRIEGRYLGYGILFVDVDQTTATKGDASQGKEVDDMAMLLKGQYDNMLVTIAANSDIEIVYDEDTDLIMVSNTVPVIIDFAPDLVVPTNIKSVTGVVYNDPSMGQYMILIRDKDDVVAGSTTAIDGITATAAAGTVYDLNGRRMQPESLRPGIYVIDGKKALIK